MEQSIADKIEHFFSQGTLLTFRKGQVIVEVGQDPSGVMWLISGVVEQYALTQEGFRIGVNLFKPPAFFPMSWAINRTHNDYFYCAMNDVEVKLRDAGETVEFLQHNPDVTFDLLSRVYRGADGLLQKLTLTGSKVARDRLIFELITECYRFGEQVNEQAWRIQITQTSLAARSGLARETISRELRKLSESKLIVLHRGVIEVELELLKQELNH